MSHNSNIKMAIVNESEYLRRKIISYVEEAGFYVVGHARNVEEGMTLSVTSDANLFIIDVLMQGESGLYLLKALSDNNYKGHSIAMSSLLTDNIVIEAIRNGAVDFLKKPFGKQELIRIIEAIDYRMKGEKG